MEVHQKIFLCHLCITQCPATLASKRRCAFSSFMWNNTQGWNITNHPWAHKHKIAVLWCLATWLLQDYDQDARATQKTATHQFDHLFHSHNHIICDCRQRNSFWLWVSPGERAMLMSCWCLNFSSQALLSLEGQDHAWLWEMHTQRLQQALLLLTMNTASRHYSTVLPQSVSQSSPHWRSFGFPSMKDYLLILL